MTPVDLMMWSFALIVFMAALGAVAVITVLVTRFLEQQRANLAAHRALKASQAAADRAAEQRAELEAADILERRLALPLGNRTTSLGEQLEARMDAAAEVIRQVRKDQAELTRKLTTQGAQLTAVLSLRDGDRQRVLHTDTPLRSDGGQR